ncbi:DUF2252 domain-containing protein [Kocuria sediminis]|uniref:DUF2252 domain-containing protein n=1 Tax=Kocuria sediminis TaxID=1038857 RepID=A0A6N8GMI8_9MICC|nr:DUF2252 domain-containing protein [Kocuria sediminis]
MTPSPTPPPRSAEAAERARERCPLPAHGLLEPAGAQRDPVALLRSQDEGRLPELVPLRHERMAASPFAFFRGAALVMAHDLARRPATGLEVQLCGDAHLSNFGVFGTPERRLLFDLNDFDETARGPWEWDVLRLAASLAVAGRQNGVGRGERRGVVAAAARSYRRAVRGFARESTLAVWYAAADTEQVRHQYARGKEASRRTEAALRKARSRDSRRLLGTLTEEVAGRPRFASDPPVLVPARELLGPAGRTALAERMTRLLDGYRETLVSDRRFLLDQFDVVDIARSVRGLGSVGTRSWLVLLTGRADGEPLFLQVKEAGESALTAAGAVPSGAPGAGHGGERVVAGQRLMQAASDTFLGWLSVVDADGVPRDYYVRQLRDWKASAAVERMTPGGMRSYGELCGWTLARAHARSGDRMALAAYLAKGKVLDEALADFAEAYADRNDEDHRRFCAALEAGDLAPGPARPSRATASGGPSA